MSIGFIYVLGEKYTGPVKIGFSKNPERRLIDLKAAFPYRVELLAVAPGSIFDESYIHSCFSKYALESEWFSRTRKILQFIKAIQSTGKLPDVFLSGRSVSKVPKRTSKCSAMDAKVIEQFGGYAKLAEFLHVDRRLVHNWKKFGISPVGRFRIRTLAGKRRTLLPDGFVEQMLKKNER